MRQARWAVGTFSVLWPPAGGAVTARPPVAWCGQRRGRGRAASCSTKIDLARQRYQAGQTVEEIAAALGVSRATVYRHLETSRSDA